MSRIIKFQAKDIGGSDEDFAITVGFARDRTDEHTDDGLILPRAKEGDTDDPAIYNELPRSELRGIEGRSCERFPFRHPGIF